jgi:hydroxymethylpyrimidine/phosphomethylpyrimidine kinase
MNVALTIAGSDSGGGAGIQADLKTFEAHGVFGTAAITSVTAQNTTGVRGVYDLSPEAVVDQINAVLDDFAVAAIKIGMLSNEEIVRAVARTLRDRAGQVPIILDPVMVSTSGHRLLRPGAVDALVSELFPLAVLVTPNVAEASLLTGIVVEDAASMDAAACAVAALGAASVLVKGGDLQEEGASTDILLTGGEIIRLAAPRIESTSTHGTGCTLSSAIAANLARGRSLVAAVEKGKEYVTEAIRRAPGLGAGAGPLRHGIEGFGR